MRWSPRSRASRSCTTPCADASRASGRSGRTPPQSSAWLAQRNATVEDIDHVVLEAHGFEEVVLHLDGEEGRSPVRTRRRPRARRPDRRAADLLQPLAADRPPRDPPTAVAARPRAARIRHRRRVPARARGRRRRRGRGGVRSGRLRARARGRRARPRAEACARSTSGCSRTAAGSRWSTARSSTTGARARSSTTSCGGGETELPPQAGIGVYVRGESGKLAAARVYDDAEPPLT